ncbi:MAG: hypothetical protein OEM62_02125 [Acidobacteriota bacterium]|nr:hypothetical protein [Acidobacteriota bacterium]
MQDVVILGTARTPVWARQALVRDAPPFVSAAVKQLPFWWRI